MPCRHPAETGYSVKQLGTGRIVAVRDEFKAIISDDFGHAKKRGTPWIPGKSTLPLHEYWTPTSWTSIVPLKQIEYGLGPIIMRSAYTPYSIYLSGTIIAWDGVPYMPPTPAQTKA